MSSERSADERLGSSNRYPPSSKVEFGTGWGVDRVALTFAGEPVGTVEFTAERNRVVKSPSVRGQEVHLAMFPRAGNVWSRTDFNPSRLVDPRGFALASVDEAVDAAFEVLRAVLRFITPHGPLSKVHVQELHVSRDFHVLDPQGYIAALSQVPPLTATKETTREMFSSPMESLPESLYLAAGKSGRVLLYDKHAETGGLAPRGTLRFEVQARKPWVRRYSGVRVLEDLNVTSVRRLLSSRWEWSGMGTNVCDMETFEREVYRLVEDEEMSDLDAQRFVGWYHLKSGGHSTHVGDGRLARYRELLRAIGVTAPEHNRPAASPLPVIRRLDLEAGQEEILASSP